jgi:predicted nucleic acid-binding protein
MLESKVIQTRFEKEIFIEEKSNIKINGFRSLDKNTPFYEFMIGLDLIRIRDHEYYGTKKSYVNIRISEDLQSLFVIEPDVQSIFAIKNKLEKEAAIELVQYLLVDSQIFKQVVSEMISNLKKENFVNGFEVKDAKAKLAVLERLLNVSDEDIHFTIRMENIA